MNITQTYKDNYSHSKHILGIPKDYPIDDNCGTSQKTGYFYCPCDEMIVRKIYGVGLRSTNSLWLESTSKVITPTFNDYVTIQIAHPNDNEFQNIYVGKKYQRYDKIFREGNDGFATGNHFHISVGRGKMLGTGWQKNTYGAWVIKTTLGGVRPEEAFFIDNKFTTIKNNRKIAFISINEKANNIFYTTARSLNVRCGPGINYKVLNTFPKNTKVQIYEQKGSWGKISNHEWLSTNYVTNKKPPKYYETTITTAHRLNVRNKPNGKKLSYKAPLIKNTSVAIMKKSGNWTQINIARWVYNIFLK